MRALLLSLAAAALLMAKPCTAAEFPPAPADAAAAEAAGLQRLAADRLKVEFTAAREERNSRGENYVAHYGVDGRIELRAGGSSLIDRGTFSVTGQRGGSVCLMLEKQMNQRLCSIWFAAPDGVHLFGYNPSDGRLRAISRPAQR
jgi:hypothetical protein